MDIYGYVVSMTAAPEPAAALAATSPVDPSRLAWSLGDRLRKVRRLMDLSQDEFAQKLGVGKPAYVAWETDRNFPQNIVAVARRIEMLSGVPAAWTLGVSEPLPASGSSGATGASTGGYKNPSRGVPAALSLVPAVTHDYLDGTDEAPPLAGPHLRPVA